MAAFDFSELVLSFDNSAEEPILVERNQGVTLQYGTISDEGAWLDIHLSPPYCVWPTTNELVRVLADGNRIDGDLVIFTQVPLRADHPLNQTKADRITTLNNGNVYLAHETPTWGPGGKYFMCIAKRKEDA